MTMSATFLPFYSSSDHFFSGGNLSFSLFRAQFTEFFYPQKSHILFTKHSNFYKGCSLLIIVGVKKMSIRGVTMIVFIVTIPTYLVFSANVLSPFACVFN